MSEANTAPPSDAGRGSFPRRSRGRHRGGYNNPARPMRRHSRPPASETQTESPKPSALQLDTNAQAPSAPTASKDPPDLKLPAKPVTAIEEWEKHRPWGHSKPRGPKSEKPSVGDQPSTSEKQPQVASYLPLLQNQLPINYVLQSAPAPKADVTASPTPTTDLPANGPRRGSRNSRRGGLSGPRRRPDKQPMRDSPAVSTPREPSMEPDSSSASSISAVLTPPQPPASLAPEDLSPSSSQTRDGPKRGRKKPHIQNGPVSLDMWAESAPSDIWKAEPIQNAWDSQVPTSIHIDSRPTTSTAPPSKPPVPAPVAEKSKSTSKANKGPKKDAPQPPDKPAGLDAWAERGPSDNFWNAEPTPKPQDSHTPTPTPTPTPVATQPNRPTPAATTSNKPPGPTSAKKNTQSGSRGNKESKRGAKPPPSDPPANLDTWALSTPNEDVWKLEPTPTHSPRPPHAPTPSARLDHRPTRSTTPANDPAGPAHPIQPPVDDSPTAMRRVGLAHVLFGPGACVQTVFTDAESPWVMLSNLPRNFKRHNLQPLLAAFGPTRHIKMIEARRETKYLPSARILFEKHEQARYAVDSLQGQLVMGKPIAARLDTDASGALHPNNIPGLSDDTAAPSANKPQSSLIANDTMATIKSATVKVTWFSPTSTVYVTYRNPKFAIDRVKEMNGRTFMNRRVKMTLMFPERANNLEEIARENGGFIVRMNGLMGDPEMEKLRRFVRSDDVVVHPNYSSEAALPRLREELADIAPLESFRLLPHRRDDLKLHALAQYTTPAAAAAAVKIFEGRRGEYLGGSPILVSRHLTVRYSISSKLAEVLQGEINKLHSWAIDDPDLLVRQNEDQYKPGFIQLLLAGNDTKQLVAAKSQLDRALGGIPLTTVDGVKIWDSYFTTEDGASFLESVAEKCKICARVDQRTNSILLFGPRYARNDASQELRAKLVSHSRLRHVVRIQGPVFRRLAAGGITILRDLLGRGNIYVDLLDQTLTFYGNDEVALRVQKALDLMYSETGSKLRRRSDCVVCFCPPEKALLLACGHHYCKSCFTQYVASAAENRTLPLLCVGEGCKASIPLSLITLHANQPDQDALFYAAFQAYITSHPDQYRYCPTPDCQYIYRVGPEDAAVQCRLCLSNICTHCHVEQHEGIACADYKASHDESEIQKSFDRWRAANNVKPCPNCAAPIEKIAGCNHMMCSACRTHMCWVCLAGFSKGDEVYDHMRSKHGGIGL